MKNARRATDPPRAKGRWGQKEEKRRKKDTVYTRIKIAKHKGGGKKCVTAPHPCECVHTCLKALMAGAEAPEQWVCCKVRGSHPSLSEFMHQWNFRNTMAA